MSKKNLSRSILEGGRHSGNKWDRRDSHRKERQYGKRFTDYAINDEEMGDGRVARARNRVYKGFDDKLAPIYRWLRSKVGEPWNDVYSELRSKFDTRTIAGKHIVQDHVLSSVQIGEDINDWRGGRYFVVRQDGILNLGDKNRWQKTYPKDPHEDLKKIGGNALLRWAGSLKVMDYGAVQYWAVPIDLAWRECNDRYCIYDHRTATKTKLMDARHNSWWARVNNAEKVINNGVECYKARVQVKEHYSGSRNYRQGNALTKEQAEFWKNLHPNSKAYLLWEDWKPEVRKQKAEEERKLRERLKAVYK